MASFQLKITKQANKQKSMEYIYERYLLESKSMWDKMLTLAEKVLKTHNYADI